MNSITVTQQEFDPELPRILIVEPLADRQRTLHQLLTQDGSPYAPKFAATARQAIGHCRNEDMHCVLLSDALPDQDSLDVIGALRHPRTGSPLPVVLLTSERDDQRTLAALRSGASEVLAWERVDAQQLASKIEAATERVELREALAQQRLEKQLAMLELMRRQGQLADTCDEIVHALRTPLGSIQEFISLLIDGIGGSITETQGKYLALARGACHTLDREIGGLHRLTDVMEPSPEGWQEEFFVQDLFEFVISELTLQAQGAHVALAYETADDLAPVAADVLQISQVLVALISHGIDLAKHGGQVRLLADLSSKENGRVDIGVEVVPGHPGIVPIPQRERDVHESAPWLESSEVPRCRDILGRHGTDLRLTQRADGISVYAFKLAMVLWK